MKKFLLDLLVCPHCKGELRLEGAEYAGKEIESGRLACSCGEVFSIKNSIPRFIRPENYADSFSFQWRYFSKTQLDSFNKTHISENRFREITDLSHKRLDNKVVLDAGCGMGRFLEIAAKSNAQVVGIDMSLAVDAAKANLKDFPNVHIVQASIFNMPFKRHSFDFIYSIGVLHNTPDPKKAFKSLTPFLSKNAGIAVWLGPKTKFPWFFTATRAVRSFTPNMKPVFLLKLVRSLVPLCLPLVRIPFIGPLLKGKIIPVCDYKNQLPLNNAQLLEWSVLDTFNILSPKYLHPCKPQEVKSWFLESGLRDIQITSPSVTGRAHS
ncbi:MAG: methyltransferase domain-containing protein [Candidatus Gorgyraea atricola]|nr:methyltransferase domain-containing protein [Candidatus Gorgyraea atricola]